MKRILITLLFALIANIGLQAQWDSLTSQEPVHNIIKLSPFHFAEGTFLLSYEHIMANEKSSIMVLAGLHSRENFNAPEPSFGFQYRFYVSPQKTPVLAVATSFSSKVFTPAPMFTTATAPNPGRCLTGFYSPIPS
jgi:hypothetical protein